MPAKINIKRVLAAAMTVCFFASAMPAAALDAIRLPVPQMQGGKPLMQALKDRRSTRSFSPKKLSLKTIANLLWAANGINRPGEGKRTAPSAMNRQPIDIYVAMEEGLYLYDAQNNRLIPVRAKDIRALTGSQSYVKEAPVNLVYVADTSRMGDLSAEMKEFYGAVDTGFISQNVYLYCSSKGLATVVRRLIDIPALAREMGLRPDQEIILSQTVGYPK